jgi:hypothetical protein
MTHGPTIVLGCLVATAFGVVFSLPILRWIERARAHGSDLARWLTGDVSPDEEALRKWTLLLLGMMAVSAGAVTAVDVPFGLLDGLTHRVPQPPWLGWSVLAAQWTCSGILASVGIVVLWLGRPVARST